MPIKPENRGRYPADWPAIRKAMLLLAGNRCEHHEAAAHRCRAVHRELGYWRQADVYRLPVGCERLQRTAWLWTALPHALRESGVDKPLTLMTAEGPLKIIRVVLTIAHLDHQPENCDPGNLRALCQRHHLAHDRLHHLATAQATRRARSGTAELF